MRRNVKFNKFEATVIRVVDGDTVWFNADLGFRVNYEVDIRLADINAPELKTSEGKVSKEALAHFFEDHKGQQIVLETEKNPGSYNRWTGKIWVGETYLNEWLVKNNYAANYDYKWD